MSAPGRQAASLSSVGMSTSSAVCFFSNNNTRFRTIFNDSAADMYVALAASASSTAFSYRVPTNGTVEINNYGGPVSAVLASGTGNARCTEW